MGGEEVSGELVVSGCDAAPFFDAAEEVFDFVPPAVEALGAISVLNGIAAVWEDRQGAFVPDVLTYFFAIVGLIGGDGQR